MPRSSQKTQHYISSGTNSRGNRYHRSSDGSYYYSNRDGSTYYNSGTGYKNYTPPCSWARQVAQHATLRTEYHHHHHHHTSAPVAPVTSAFAPGPSPGPQRCVHLTQEGKPPLEDTNGTAVLVGAAAAALLLGSAAVVAYSYSGVSSEGTLQETLAEKYRQALEDELSKV